MVELGLGVALVVGAVRLALLLAIGSALVLVGATLPGLVALRVVDFGQLDVLRSGLKSGLGFGAVIADIGWRDLGDQWDAVVPSLEMWRDKGVLRLRRRERRAAFA